MKENVTILSKWSETTPERSARMSCFGLPAYLLEKARKRLRFLALLFVGMCVAAAGIVAIIGQQGTRPLYGIYLICGIASTFVYVISRIKSVRHSAVLNIGLAYEIVLCFVVSVGTMWSTIIDRGAPAELTWTCLLMWSFP